jgi:hypothetical protein
MASVAVRNQERDDVLRCRRNIRCQHLLNPGKHHLLIHPRGFLAGIMVACQYVSNSNRAMCLSCFPFKMIVDGRTILSLAIVTAMVACLGSFDDVRIWTVFLPTNSNVLFVLIKKIDQRLIHVEDETPVAMRAK